MYLSVLRNNDKKKINKPKQANENILGIFKITSCQSSVIQKPIKTKRLDSHQQRQANLTQKAKETKYSKQTCLDC